MLGTYEKEIQSDLMGFAADARTFLNIGCAEGYYTTGLAVCADLQQVVGVDVDQRALQAAIAYAQLNGVNHQCRFSDFPDLNLPCNFFDQCLLGMEGRPGDQSWLIASKAER